MKYANATQNTQTLKSTKFEYCIDDCICEMCLYYKGKSRSSKASCELEACCCADIRAAALAADRINRPRTSAVSEGWDKE